MLLTKAMSELSGDQVGCAAFDAGSGVPLVGTFIPVAGLMRRSAVPSLMTRRVPSPLKVAKSELYVLTGAIVGAGLPIVTLGFDRSNTAPDRPPPQSSP